VFWLKPLVRILIIWAAFSAIRSHFFLSVRVILLVLPFRVWVLNFPKASAEARLNISFSSFIVFCRSCSARVSTFCSSFVIFSMSIVVWERFGEILVHPFSFSVHCSIYKPLSL
jgi:hypothetical protein